MFWIKVLLFIGYFVLSLCIFGIFWMLFIEPFRKLDKPDSGLVSRIEQNHIKIPDHETPEPKQIKRTRKLEPGTTNLDQDNPLRVKELKQLARVSMKKLKR